MFKKFYYKIEFLQELTMIQYEQQQLYSYHIIFKRTVVQIGLMTMSLCTSR